MSNRRVPDWLRKRENVNGQENKKPRISENGISQQSTALNNLENLNTRVLRSRSNLVKSSSTEQDEKIPKTPLPFIEYQGSIKYLTDSIDIACACDEMINWINSHEDQIIPIAFDMEWPFSFQTGSGKTSVIQICANEDLCYVFHISQLKKIPAAINALLSHTKVKLHGVNIKNDIRKLKRDFPEIAKEKIDIMIGQCLDLGTWCNEVCNTGGRWSLERLVHYICKLRINKDKKVRMSKWNIVPLSDEQKLYAAIDVYISQVIYKKLQKMEEEKEQRRAEIVEMHGEKSLQALTSLGFDFIDKKDF